MNEQHTPGPWSWQPNGKDVGSRPLPRHYNLVGFTGKGLANLVVKSEDEVWPKSPDARLIASAPALLQELRNIANADWRQWEENASPEEFVAWAQNGARAAIAKATEA